MNIKKRPLSRTATTYQKCNKIPFLPGVFTDPTMAGCWIRRNIVGMEERKWRFSTY